ncbi:Transcriptional regulatory protein PmpR [compost metagenome]
MRHAFSKCGGNLGTDGSVAYMFDRKGQISFAPGVNEDALMEAALEAGADDIVTNDDGSMDVFTSFADFLAVNEALTAAGFKGDEAEVAMIPSITAPISDLETAQKVLKLIDMLEDLDDVQSVYHNAEIPDEIMEQLG